MIQLSLAGLAFVRGRESFRAEAYLDSGGVPTVGYGSTGPDIHLGMVVSEAWAAARLQRDMGAAVLCINAHVRVALTQAEFDALCDFAYNIGQHAFADSTLLRLLNTGDYAGADEQFGLWDHADGRVISGLAARRKAEAAMFAAEAA